MFVVVNSVLKPDSGLLWDTVEEVLIQVHKIMDLIITYNCTDKDFLAYQYAISTGQEIPGSRLEKIIETVKESANNGKS